MAWNPSPKVADCRDIARKWNVKQVIVLAIDPVHDRYEVVSFGETRALCAHAKIINDQICRLVEDGTIG